MKKKLVQFKYTYNIFIVDRRIRVDYFSVEINVQGKYKITLCHKTIYNKWQNPNIF